MTRRAMLTLFFAKPKQGADYVDELCRKVLAFEAVHDPFVRALFGCSATGEINHTNCTYAAREIKYDLMLKAADKAMDLYGQVGKDKE